MRPRCSTRRPGARPALDERHSRADRAVMSKASFALVILVATATVLAQQRDTQVVEFSQGKPGDVGRVPGIFFYGKVSGNVRLSRSNSGTYLISILIPRTTSQGERVQPPPIAEVRVWPLASDGSTVEMVSKPSDGSEPATLSLGDRGFTVLGPFEFKGVIGPFEFKGNRQLVAVAFKIGACYLMPVWRDGGPQPAMSTIASPVPCSD